jgi:hypothetical protein
LDFSFVERRAIGNPLLPLVLVGLLSCLIIAIASASEPGSGEDGDEPRPTFGSDPDDPSNILTREIPQRRTERESVFPVSPLKSLHDATDKAKKELYDATYLDLGLTLNHLFQWSSDSLPGTDDWGTTTDADFVGSWELVNRGEPTRGKAYFLVQGRWDYGTTGPQELGFDSLGTAGGTANTFSAYSPTFILRNLYWEQGTPEAGWAVRTGKMSPDAMVGTSRWISPNTTFLPHVGTGFFSNGLPDSGLGLAGTYFPSERFKVMALVSDANANRFDWGDITAGDFYTALEFAYKIAPRTENAGFSKLTIWHNDGTQDGQPINGSTGREGWGMTVKLEQEFTADGRAIGILRWGKSWNDSALYNQQLGLHFLYDNPSGPAGLKHDIVGIAGNWVDSVVAGSRDEYNLEVFYRFPLFPSLDMRLSYQYVHHPALTTQIDQVSVFSLGLRTVF